MRAVIVGAGPTGLYVAIALARRGHQVVVFDRDPGPGGGQRWDRRGVMQFHHPHFFRHQVAEALLAEMPEVWHGLLAAGAEPATAPGRPGVLAGLHCRRLTFERVLRSAAEAEPGVTLRTGHVDEVSGVRGHVTGVMAGGRQVDADLVIDAGGRSGRLTRALRGPAEGGDCGIAYVSRQYQMVPGAPDGPVNAPFGVIETYPGYLVAVFIHDNRILSVLIARASTDRQLAALRDPAAFETAARAIPVLAAWTDQGRCRPITAVLPGGRLYNSYRGQLNDAGRAALDGLIYAGDAVCTTNPAAGRGVTTSLLQARQLIGLLEEHGRDFSSCSLAFDHWCARNIKPWFDDHVYWDTDLIRRWPGQDVDLTRPLPPDLVIAAAQADPGLIKAIGPYQAMLALPASLDAVQARARAIYASGWRPPIPPGPTRQELAGLVTAAASSHNHPAGEAALPAALARRRHADLGELQLASARGRLTAGRGHPARYPRRGGARRVLTIPDDTRTEEGDYGGAQTGPRLGGSVPAGGNEFSSELLHRVGSRTLGPKSDHAQLLALVRGQCARIRLSSGWARHADDSDPRRRHIPGRASTRSGSSPPRSAGGRARSGPRWLKEVGTACEPVWWACDGVSGPAPTGLPKHAAGGWRAAGTGRPGCDNRRVQAIVRRARPDDQPVITAMVRRARLNPAGLHWEQFVVGERDGRAVGVAQLRRHPDGTKELASLVVEPGAREHGIATQMVDALLAGETAAVYALVDRRFADHFARWGFRQAGPSELPRSVSRTYVIGRAVTTLGSLLRWQRIRIVPLLRPAR